MRQCAPLVCFFSLCAAAMPASAQTYSFVDLSQFTNGGLGYSAANSINASGQIAGTSTFSSFDSTTRFATLWSGGVATNLGALVQGLNGNSAAYAVSTSGQVVGYAPVTIENLCVVCWYFGVSWNGVSSVSRLPNFPNLGSPIPAVGIGTANATNTGGTIVGFSAAGDPSSNFVGNSRAVKWASGPAVDLGVLAGFGASYANGINDSSLVVGWSQPVGNNLLPTQRATSWSNGAIIDLGSQTGASGRSVANAVNNAGDIAGWSDTTSGSPHAVVWKGGALIDLGTLPGFARSQANAINGLGWIVGTSAVPTLDGGAGGRAVLWKGGAILDLNSLLTPAQASQLVLRSANGINDDGSIVGEAFVLNSGLSRAFLLLATPVRAAAVQAPVNADGSSVFKGAKGVVPVVFSLSSNGQATCSLPRATLSLTKISSANPPMVNENLFTASADSGTAYRIQNCQYLYNVATKSLDKGTYRIEVVIAGQSVGLAEFGVR